MSPTTAAPPPHILVFPYPAQGHTIPLLDLIHQLCLRNLTNITIITTPKNLPTLSPLLTVHPVIGTLVLPFPPHPDLPPGVENVKEIGNSGNLPIVVSLSKLHDPIVQWFKSHDNPPVALISDFFLGFTLQMAREMGIPRFTFFTSGAYLAAVADYLWHRPELAKGMKVVDFVDLPGSPSFTELRLPSTFRRYKPGDPDWEFFRNGMIANLLSYGCVFNSFEALEFEYLEYVKRKTKVYSVGPLSLLGLNREIREDLETGSGHDVFRWLDECPDGSVLYVCFGSQKLMNKNQMEAVASALEKSMTRFLWVVKTGTTREEEAGYGLVPGGFEERVGGRGLVIRGWAPQVQILSHRAVGGFLSHCGWNSVLESVVSGVMILGWPMEADQFVDARLLVDELGVGVRVCEGADTVPDSVELAGKIAESLSGDVVQERVRARGLKDKALVAVRDGGSSCTDLDGLAKEFFNFLRSS
ncbi:hypothetical protein K2173_017043 [Erythroxylum novogranatense]|uniref:Glycosyltransferase n=1 Tax=Erythroxylum novogranatense TaxID=1862640 RepID=A0AAV8U5K0_9ROSI|nr:hypothetical protein K2173_017043 [Erythroxylum novogranatense]